MGPFTAPASRAALPAAASRPARRHACCATGGRSTAQPPGSSASASEPARAASRPERRAAASEPVRARGARCRAVCSGFAAGSGRRPRIPSGASPPPDGRPREPPRERPGAADFTDATAPGPPGRGRFAGERLRRLRNDPSGCGRRPFLPPVRDAPAQGSLRPMRDRASSLLEFLHPLRYPTSRPPRALILHATGNTPCKRLTAARQPSLALNAPVAPPPGPRVRAVAHTFAC